MKEEPSSPDRTCPKCGAPIPENAPRGLCPKCLLEAVAATTVSGAATDSLSQPPSLEAVQAAFPQLEVRELIGQGGMGFVFKARQPRLDRWVALKLMPDSRSAQPAFAERFAREGRLLARLSHPNIVSVYDFGQANGFFYLLMEYVDGVNLRQAMRAGRFTPAQALAVVPAVCEALQYAHEEGVLHRDIKPENILLDTKGRIKIADFGVAKLLAERRGESLTASGAALGTPHYMAPEQIESPSDVDHRADIFSLGVVLYELLTGELPLGRFDPPSSKTPVNPQVDQIVLRALEKERARRQQSAGEMKTQIETATAGETGQPETSQPGVSDQPQTPVLRLEVVLLVGLLMALVLGGARLWDTARYTAGLWDTARFGAPLVSRLIGLVSGILVLILVLALWAAPIRWVWRRRSQFLSPFGITPPGLYGKRDGFTLSWERALYSTGSVTLMCWTFQLAMILSFSSISCVESFAWSIGVWGIIPTLLPIAFPAAAVFAFVRRNRCFVSAAASPMPPWARRAGMAFMVAAFVPLLRGWGLGDNHVTTFDTCILLAGIGIALMSRNRAWRSASSAINWYALFLSLYGLGTILLLIFGEQLGFKIPADVFRSTPWESFSLLLSRVAYPVLFIAGLWTLNHREVLPAFGLANNQSKQS